jgi:hypothetical protein
MSKGWVEAVLRLNSRIVEGEARFNRDVEKLAARQDAGEDVSDDEAGQLLAAHYRRLYLLRAMQAELLQHGDEEAE